jgi:hypothetical protein
VKRSDFQFFYQRDYLEKNLHDKILEELPVLDNSKSLEINEEGNIIELDIPSGHIKNKFYTSDEPLDSILTPGIKTYKNICKQEMIHRGMKNPVLRGVLNYSNPVSMAWHKDYVEPSMQIEPTKRWITFYVACPKKPNSTFMVGPNSDGPGIWNLGFTLDLEPNMFIAHNQNLGHEYIMLEKAEINIFSLLWYDIV